MAMLDPDLLSKTASGFSALPVTRQIGILVAFAATIAIGVSVAMWARDPNYRPIYSGLSPKEAGEVIDSLQQKEIHFKYDESHGAILVPAKQVADARISLAREGLPNGDNFGFEILGTKRSFGDSQFLETARYRQALAGELSRTITSFKQVKSARVHLAIPKQSAFIHDKKRPSASVFVDLYAGRILSQESIDAIVNLVASSVPGMQSSEVTLVDDTGRLLTNPSQDARSAAADKLLRYKHQIEKTYSDKIQDILSPILGEGKIKARVAAEIDYTVTEQTQERYNPDMPSLRSESTLYESRGNALNGTGAPGALANQPPAAVRIESNAPLQNTGVPNASDAVRQSTRNFEIDKTISHTQHHPGQISRLTVAVVVDDKVSISKSGKVSRESYSAEEIDQIKALVRNAIGYNANRGDSVEVINKSFSQPPEIAALPDLPIWKQNWFWEIVKQVLGGTFLMLLIFGVIRPVMRTLAEGVKEVSEFEDEIIDDTGNSIDIDYKDPMRLPDNLQTPEARMQVAHELASDDPKRVSQVVKNWVDGSG